MVSALASRSVSMQNKLSIGALAGVLIFLAVVIAGGFYTSHRMNVTAEIHATSAGRPGDAKPDMIDDKPDPSKPRSPASPGAVPPD